VHGPSVWPGLWPQLLPPTCSRRVCSVGMGPFCHVASLPRCPGPCWSPVFRSVNCDCLSLNGYFSLISLRCEPVRSPRHNAATSARGTYASSRLGASALPASAPTSPGRSSAKSLRCGFLSSSAPGLSTTLECKPAPGPSFAGASSPAGSKFWLPSMGMSPPPPAVVSPSPSAAPAGPPSPARCVSCSAGPTPSPRTLLCPSSPRPPSSLPCVLASLRATRGESGGESSRASSEEIDTCQGSRGFGDQSTIGQGDTVNPWSGICSETRGHAA